MTRRYEDSCEMDDSIRSVMYFDGTSFTKSQSDDFGSVYDIQGDYAVGNADNGYGVFRYNGAKWTDSLLGGKPARGVYPGIDQDSEGTYWFAGFTGNANEGLLAEYDGSWQTTRVGSHSTPLFSVDMWSPTLGVGGGTNAVYVVERNRLPVPVIDVVSDNGATVTVQDGGSWDPDGGPLQYSWKWSDTATDVGPGPHTHTFGNVGSTFVELTVQDSNGARVSTTASFGDLNPETLSLGACKTGSLSSGTELARRHYHVPGLTNEWVKVYLTSGASGLHLEARDGTAVDSEGDWPEALSKERVLDGYTTDDLYVAVVKPEDESVGGSFTVCAEVSSAPAGDTDLTPIAGAGVVNYLDRVRFEVEYSNVNGEAPRDAGGNLQAPTLLVNGESHMMHQDLGAADYTAGVRYYYELTLPGGRSYVPVYEAYDSGGVQHRVQGDAVLVKQSHVVDDSFEDDAEGSIPGGWTAEATGKGKNYWHVTDTSTAATPDIVNIGGHGNALWFGHPVRGKYDDPDGRSPGGALVSRAIRLDSLEAPVLSFASYFDVAGDEAESLRVEVQEHVSGSWTEWSVLHELDGPGDGEGLWRSITLSLADYDDAEVRVRFVFQADRYNNHGLGWFIDDVIIGHDEDGDSIPDWLEATRADIREYRAGSKRVEPGTTGSSYVRNFERDSIDGLVLSSLVRFENRDEVSVEVGVEEAGLPGFDFYVIKNGVVQSVPCFTEGVGFFAPRQWVEAADVSDDGARINIDLQRCGWDKLSFASRDWFVRVEVDGAGSAATIADTVLTSGAHTMFNKADSDDDGDPDASELFWITDPTGTDSDRDLTTW